MSKPQLTKEKWGWNIFAKCECHAHAVEISWFRGDDGTYEDRVYLNFWHHGHQDYTLWERIKMAWRILRGRTVEIDEIILDREETKQFGEALVKATEELPKAVLEEAEGK